MNITENDTFKEVLESFCACTDVPATVFSPEGERLMEFLPEKKFCSLFKSVNGPHPTCRKNLIFSTQLSVELGEPYIYNCPIDFVSVAVPVISDRKFLASVILGPFSMGVVKEENIKKIFRFYPNNLEMIPKITLAISQMKIYNPTQIHSLSVLLFNSMLGCLRNWHDFEQMHSRHQSQLVIGDAINKFKTDETLFSDDSSTENKLELQLLRYVEEKNAPKANSTLKKYCAEIILIEGGNFNNAKGQFLELFGRMAESAISNGASAQKIFNIDFNLFSSLGEIQSVDDLYQWSENIVGHFIDNVYSTTLTGQSDLIKRALSFINNFYNEKLSLIELASYLHINQSYLSKLFKQEVGINFTQYLNEVRIEKSLEHLENNEMNLMEIAMLVGFEDQSYFTKVFKKVTGITPKQYRKQLQS